MDAQHEVGHDPIATSVKRAGETVVVGDAATLRREVEDLRNRRRRRRRVAVGGTLGATALVAAVGVVSVVGDDSTNDRLVSAPVTEPEQDEPEQDAPVSTAPSPTAEDGEAPASTAPPSGGSGTLAVQPATSADPVVDAGVAQDRAATAEVFAWNDGFLAVRRFSSPQPLPEQLPEEISSQFPQEVLDLFPDGLPPTLDEAMEVLREAGLLDVVTDIVLSNPEVNEAIYAEPNDVITSVRFSVDGREWADVDAAFPELANGYPSRQFTVGDRFVLVAEPNYESPDAGTYLDIHVSTDLETWEVQRIEFPAVTPERGVRHHTQLEGFAANSDGWIATATRYSNLEIAELLPADLFDDANGGWESDFDEDGVFIAVYDAAGNRGERQEFSWAELGFDAPPSLDEMPTTVSVVAAWGAEPAVTPTEYRGGRIASFGDGFVEYGESIRLSADGVDWIDVALPGDGWVQWALETTDGLVVSIGENDGPSEYLLDADSRTWTPVDLPDVPSNVQESTPGSGGAIVLVDWGESDWIEPARIELNVESDGYALTISIDPASGYQAAEYVIVDTATGEEVARDQTDRFGEVDAFDGFRETRGSFEVDLPERDGITVVFSSSDIVNTSFDENGDVLEEPEIMVESNPEMPEHWLVASVGGRLLVEEVETDTDWVVGAAVQGDVVLVALGDGTFMRFTAA